MPKRFSQAAVFVSFALFSVAVVYSSFFSYSQIKSSNPVEKSQATGRAAKSEEKGGETQQLKPRILHAPAKVALPSELHILPSAIVLAGPVAAQRIVVEGKFSDGHEEDLTAGSAITTSEPHVAALDSQPSVFGAGDGRATIRATFHGLRAEARVEVKGFTKPFVYSFRNDVLPVMTKVGCNSGPCHGALAGKNGFKLTLRGYDPEADYFTLTRQALARRTERLEPAKSLILLKPTLTIPHGGGRRFPVGSPEYKIMSGWIAEGMPAPKDTDARVEELEVLPREISLRPGAEQQILVRAHYSDGSAKDVTRWAKFSSGDMSVATVDDLGRVKMAGYGEAPVTVWYQSRVSFARLSVPFPVAIDPAVFKNAPRNNTIDDLVLKKLQFLHIPPSRPATDAEFIRRAYLDAAGILPTPAETEKFLADPSPDKRSRLVAELTARPEFVDYWTYKWSDLLLVSSKNLSPDQMWSFYDWIRESVQQNKPWDRFVYEIVTATGNSRQNGPANYFVIEHDPIQISENMTKAFLGTSITCAHCHNHPLEKWTQKDYFAMANLFARVRLKTGGFNRGGLDDATVYSSPSGDLIFPRLGRPLAPQPLDAAALSLDSPEDRRVYFAQWLTSPKNRYFAKALVNRVWKNFMGRGLVEAVDDLRETNPPSNEDLFNALTDDFIAHNFDVRTLIRTVMNSATYQTAAEPLKDNLQDEKYYSHYIIRRLPAEVMLDAISQVLQAPTQFDGYPAGTRALQLPDTQVNSYFLTVFGRPPREQTSAAERQSEPSITQALHVINGETLNDKLRAPGGSVEMLSKLGMPDERAVDYLFLAAFCRHPSAAETKEMVADLQNAEAQRLASGNANPHRAALGDFAWALVTSKEFMFDH